MLNYLSVIIVSRTLLSVSFIFCTFMWLITKMTIPFTPSRVCNLLSPWISTPLKLSWLFGLLWQIKWSKYNHIAVLSLDHQRRACFLLCWNSALPPYGEAWANLMDIETVWTRAELTQLSYTRSETDDKVQPRLAKLFRSPDKKKNSSAESSFNCYPGKVMN